MSILSFIEKLRDEPRYVRERYTFTAALLVTGMVGGIWLLSLPAKFADVSQQANLSETSRETVGPSGINDLIRETEAGIERAVNPELQQGSVIRRNVSPQPETTEQSNSPVIIIATSSTQNR